MIENGKNHLRNQRMSQTENEGLHSKDSAKMQAVAFRVLEVTSVADVRQYLEGHSVAQEYLFAVYGGF